MDTMTFNKNAILYARLSREDGDNEVSSSIKNQIDLLSNYAIKNGFRVIDICSDDGYSGGNFDRSGFKKMMQEIDSGLANVIIVKDLSRFGRDFIRVSKYIDDYFVENHIRFISVNDNHDSATSTEDISIVLKNFMNGLYLKEFKKKTRLGIDNKAKKESLKYTGFYGYKNINGKLEIDYDVAPIIVRIFNEYISGKKPTEICRGLNEDGIMSPGEYREKNHIGGYKNKCKSEPRWCAKTVIEITKKREYVGDTVNQIHIYNNGKCKINNNPIILENTHEAIIDLETFNKAQEKRYKITKTSKEISDRLLCDILKTYNNRKIHYAFKRKNKNPEERNEYYECKADKVLVRIDYTHKVLYEYSLSMIKRILKNKDKFKSEMVKLLIESSNFDERIKEIEKELASVDYTFSKLFEQYAFEEISLDEYDSKRENLTAYQIKLTNEKNELKSNSKTIYEINKSLDSFIDSVNNKTLHMRDIELIRFCIKEVFIKRNGNLFEFRIIDVFS